jgi:hypothetical protein
MGNTGRIVELYQKKGSRKMSNILEYVLKLNDGMSGAMQKITGESGNLKNALTQASGAASALGNVLKTVGIGFGAFKIAGMTQEGITKVRALHAAEAQLANTMKNMGTYSREAYDKAVKGAGALSKSVLYGRSEIISLQSRLRMVGNIGENEMDRLTAASADMAAKFGTGLDEAGNAIAKAVNNPEMMRRLAMQLKIDPDTVGRIEKIAKAGDEAKARLMLIDIAEQKVGGAARAAFDADPLARYDKILGSVKMTLGGVAVKIQKTLAPVMEIAGELMSGAVSRVTEVFGRFFGKLREGDPVISGIAVALGSFVALVAVITAVTKIWAAAQWLINVAMSANPVGIVIAGIVALIAVIAYVVYATEGWGKTWDNVIRFCTTVFEMFKAALYLRWMEIQDFFTSGIELIEKGWYKLQSLWDNDAVGEGLKALEDRRNERAGEIAKQRKVVDDFREKLKEMPVWEVKVTKSLKDAQNDLAGKMGISAPGVPGAGNTNVAGGGGVPAGGGGGGSGAGGKTADGIATGGTKTTHITVNVGEMGNNMKIYVTGLKEGAENMRDIILDEMARVLSMAQGQVN